MDFIRIYTGKDGETHFEDCTLELTDGEYAPPAAPMLTSDAWPADDVTFISCPVGWHGDWHPTPAYQWMLILRGTVGCQVSDGAERIIEPGTLVLLEDTDGKGHRSWQAGPEPFLMAGIRIRPR